MSHTAANILLHFIFSTRERRPSTVVHTFDITSIYTFPQLQLPAL
jgi:hypothetical protein